MKRLILIVGLFCRGYWINQHIEGFLVTDNNTVCPVVLDVIPDFLKMLETKYSSFSKQNKRLAGYFLHHHVKAAFQTTAEVAQAAGVSPATVIRFASLLGFQGFSDLQQNLQRIVQSAIRNNEVLRIEPEKSENPLQETVEVASQSLAEFNESRDDDSFARAAQLLFSARKIVTVGHKASLGVAAHSAYVLSKVHSDVHYIQSVDEFDSFSAIDDLDERDVALVFTVIHYPTATLRIMRLLHSRGVQIVLVSDFRSFKEAEYAKVSLLAPIRFQGFLDIMTPMLAIADALAFAVFKQDEDKGKARLKRFNAFNEEHQAFNDVCRFGS